jgi:hypothetical protein
VMCRRRSLRQQNPARPRAWFACMRRVPAHHAVVPACRPGSTTLCSPLTRKHGVLVGLRLARLWQRGVARLHDRRDVGCQAVAHAWWGWRWWMMVVVLRQLHHLQPRRCRTPPQQRT